MPNDQETCRQQYATTGRGRVIRAAHECGEEWALWSGDDFVLSMLRVKAGTTMVWPVTCEFAVYTVVCGRIDFQGVKYDDGGRIALTAGQTASITVACDRPFVDVIEQRAEAVRVKR